MTMTMYEAQGLEQANWYKDSWTQMTMTMYEAQGLEQANWIQRQLNADDNDHVWGTRTWTGELNTNTAECRLSQFFKANTHFWPSFHWPNCPVILLGTCQLPKVLKVIVCHYQYNNVNRVKAEKQQPFYDPFSRTTSVNWYQETIRYINHYYHHYPPHGPSELLISLLHLQWTNTSFLFICRRGREIGSKFPKPYNCLYDVEWSAGHDLNEATVKETVIHDASITDCNCSEQSHDKVSCGQHLAFHPRRRSSLSAFHTTLHDSSRPHQSSASRWT